LTLSDAVRLLLTQIAKEHAFPISLLAPNKTTTQAIKESRSKKLKSFSSLEALMDDLNADD
jgi:DNA-damage-inducible protein J